MEWIHKIHSDALSLWKDMDQNALITICITSAAATIITAWLWSCSSSKHASKKTKKKGKRSQKKSTQQGLTPLSLEDSIHNVLQKFKEQYQSGIKNLQDNFNPESEQDVYQRNYFNEMLLKLLIELDGIDLTQIEGPRKQKLKIQRKTAIKEIQDNLKALDAITH